MAVKLCFLGNFRVPHTSENDYLWTMRERLGIEVTTLQETDVTGEQVEQSALECDALLWVHTHGWGTPGKPMREVLATLKAEGITTFAYHLDLYKGLGDRWVKYKKHDYLKVEHFFTVDLGMAEWLNENTTTKGHFIRAGVVERDCSLADKEKTQDIAFVGSYNYHAEWPYRRFLIDWLKAKYGDRFTLWGSQGAGVVRGPVLNKVYAETKIIVGDTLCPDFNYPYYTSDRAYEVLGRGGFLIHPFIKGMDEELKAGEHLAYYRYLDMPGLGESIDYYLTHDAEREAIRSAGHAKVKADCTYTNRLREIFATLEGESNG